MGERDVGHDLAQARAQALLVGGIRIGMDQRYRDSLRATSSRFTDGFFHRLVGKFHEHVTAGIEALAYLESARLGDMRREFGR